MKRIDELCNDGKYKIIDEQDLISSFPSDYNVTRESLKEMLSYLYEHNYINIKYSDGGMYCVCPLPAGRIFLEKSKEVSNENKNKYLLPALVSFFGAFTGAFFAALAVILTLKLSGG